MPVSVSASGTQSATIGTEHSLKIETAAGAYELHVDCQAMLAGDTTELRLKEELLQGDTPLQAAAYLAPSGAAAEPKIKVIGPIACDRGVTATLKQTAGTGRSYKWKLLRVGLWWLAALVPVLMPA